MNAIRPLDTADDATLLVSRFQREADPVREWPQYEIHPVGGLWAELQGYRVVIVCGPNVTATDGIIYPTYTDALAARSLIEEANEPAPAPEVARMTEALTERQQAADYHASEHEWNSALGREEDA